MSISKLMTPQVFAKADMEERLYLNQYIQTGTYAGVAEMFDVNRTTALRKIRKALERVHGKPLPILKNGRLKEDE
jgi:hypothetical protein